MRFARQFILLLGLMFGFTAVPTLQAQSQPDTHHFSLQAIGNDGESIIPYFILDGESGGQVSGKIYIINQGDLLGSVQLYTVDAVTGNTGGTVLSLRADPLEEVGSWIQLERDSVTLAPGEGQMIPFVVNVPGNVRNGAHVGAIVMESADDNQPEQAASQDEVSFQVDVKTRTAVAVQINLPGTAVEQLDVLGLTIGGHDSRQIMFLHLRNSGTELLWPSVNMHILDSQGQRIQNYRFNIDTFLPEDEIEFPIHVQGEALPAGSYTAELSVRYGETIQVHHNQLTLTIREADNVQIFEGRDALAAPLATNTEELVSGRSAVEIFVMGGLGFLLIALSIYFVLLIVQTQRIKKKRPVKTMVVQPIQQQVQGQMMPGQQPRRAPVPLSTGKPIPNRNRSLR